MPVLRGTVNSSNRKFVVSGERQSPARACRYTIGHGAISYLTFASDVRPLRFARENLVIPRFIPMRCYSRYIFGCLSVRLCLLKFMHQFSIFHFHCAFGETSFCAYIPEHDHMLLRIPRVETVDVRARLPVGDEFVADANRLPVLRPGKSRVNLFLLSLR